jgi:dTDP-4-amino-4,6-dideoxygalactose transaminase
VKTVIYLSPPQLSGIEHVFLKDALESNWIAPMGPQLDAFERELGVVLNTPHLLAANSGTSAIHLALLALGVKAGDEVLCSTLTFCATINPVIYCGASPVFIDSEKQSWNIDPLLLENALKERQATGRKVKAIIVVHLFGMPAQMEKIMELSKRYNVPVVEDSAEALGSNYQGRPLGTMGKAGVLSFNGNKIITTSGGGALFSEDAQLIARARYYASEAREPVPFYEHTAVGFNYRFSNILASLGRAQLTVLNERVKKRRETFEFYASNLNRLSSVSLQPEAPGSFSNRWLTAVLFPNEKIKEQIRLALSHEQIESRHVWKPMHLQPVFSAYPAYLNGASEDLFRRGLCLPSGTQLEINDLERIIAIIKKHL